MRDVKASSHAGRMRGNERRDLILAQAKQVFARSGYTLASMGELARASNVTEALLYKHFESKKHLYLTVLQEAIERFLSTFRDRVRERAKHDLLEALSTLLLDCRAAALSDPESLQILLFASREVSDLAIIQTVQAYSSQISLLVSQLLEEAQDQGLLPAHLNLAAASWGYLSFLLALPQRVKLHLTDQIDESTLHEMNRLWLHALQSG